MKAFQKRQAIELLSTCKMSDNLSRHWTAGRFCLKPALRVAFIILFLAPPAFAQFKSPTINNPLTEGDQSIVAGPRDIEMALRAISVLKRLEGEVLIYRSLGDFEQNGKLARVSFEDFKTRLQQVMADVEPILTVLPESRLKREIANALNSYRDGMFWWSKLAQPRVIHVSALSFTEITRTTSDTAYTATVPYTVAIHWRQASKYLKRAEQLVNNRCHSTSRWRFGSA